MAVFRGKNICTPRERWNLVMSLCLTCTISVHKDSAQNVGLHPCSRGSVKVTKFRFAERSTDYLINPDRVPFFMSDESGRAFSAALHSRGFLRFRTNVYLSIVAMCVDTTLSNKTLFKSISHARPRLYCPSLEDKPW